MVTISESGGTPTWWPQADEPWPPAPQLRHHRSGVPLNADIANTDGDPGSDGQVDNGDFNVFFNFFFLGC